MMKAKVFLGAWVFTFHAKMGSIKDRNGMDLTKAEDSEEEVTRIHRRTIQKRSS